MDTLRLGIDWAWSVCCLTVITFFLAQSGEGGGVQANRQEWHFRLQLPLSRVPLSSVLGLLSNAVICGRGAHLQITAPGSGGLVGWGRTTFGVLPWNLSNRNCTTVNGQHLDGSISHKMTFTDTRVSRYWFELMKHQRVNLLLPSQDVSNSVLSKKNSSIWLQGTTMNCKELVLGFPEAFVIFLAFFRWFVPEPIVAFILVFTKHFYKKKICFLNIVLHLL